MASMDTFSDYRWHQILFILGASAMLESETIDIVGSKIDHGRNLHFFIIIRCVRTFLVDL